MFVMCLHIQCRINHSKIIQLIFNMTKTFDENTNKNVKKIPAFLLENEVLELEKQIYQNFNKSIKVC